jgi:hypothetical protein
MSKLNLDLDDLTVESFSAEASDAASQGTIRGQIGTDDPQPVSPGCVTDYELTCIDCHSVVRTECVGVATCDQLGTDELVCYQDTIADPCPGYE